MTTIQKPSIEQIGGFFVEKTEESGMQRLNRTG